MRPSADGGNCAPDRGGIDNAAVGSDGARVIGTSQLRNGLRPVRRAVWAAAVAAAIPAGAAAGQGTAAGVVDEFHGSLLGAMKAADRLGYRGRYAALAPVVARVFHLPEMTRIVAGRFWKTFDADRRRRLTEAFGRLTAATYAHRFDGYGGERFRRTGEVAVKDKTLLVETQLVKADGGTVDIDYLLRRFERGWRVVDVFLEGAFSQLATRRSEYTSLLRRRGFDALIAAIDRKVASYEAQADAR